MNNTKLIAATITILMLGACGTMEKTMEKAGMTKSAESVSATDCFTAGGTIDTATSMCKMKDGSTKAIK